MKILLVSAYDLGRPGGVQRHVLALGGALRKRGHDVRICSPGNKSIAQQEFIALGSNCVIGLAGTCFELSYINKTEIEAFVNEIVSWQADVVHYHGIWVPFLPWQLFRRLTAARVVTFHDTTVPGFTGSIMAGLFKFLSRIILSKVQGAIAVSRTPFSHLRWMENGVQPQIIAPATNLTDFFSIRKVESEKRRKILYWGRLEPRKGIATLIGAIRILVGEAKKIGDLENMPKFEIAGNGKDIVLVKEAILEFGEDVICHYSSPNDQLIYQLLATTDLVVAPSLYGESFGIVLVEALASGTPVIAANNSGYAELLTTHFPELLVQVGDEVALAIKLMELLSQPKSLSVLGERGKDFSRKFDISNFVTEFESLYRSAIHRVEISKLDARGNQD